MTFLRPAGLMVGIGVLALAACSDGQGSAMAPPRLGGSVPTAGPFRIVLSRDRYAPAVLRVGAGKAILLTLGNPDDGPHDLNLEGLGEPVHLFLNGRKEIATSLTFPRPGLYPFFCSLARHRQAGMEGEIVVED